MASSAFIELGLACDLFDKGARHSRRARSGMAILHKMREKAFQVYSQFRSGNAPIPGVLSTGRPDYGEDELALFGGQTRVLVSRLLSQSKRAAKRSSSASSSTTTSTNSSPHLNHNESRPGTSGTTTLEPADVHPSLVEYLSMFPPPQNNTPSPPHVPDDQSYTPYPNLNSQQCHSPDQEESPTFRPPNPQEVPTHAYPNWPHWPEQGMLYSNSQQGDGYSQHSHRHSFSSFKQQPQHQFGQLPTPGLDSFNHSAGPSHLAGEPGQSNLSDLMMFTGESGMDQQWMSFMRDSGFLDPATRYPQGFGSQPGRMGPPPLPNPTLDGMF